MSQDEHSVLLDHEEQFSKTFENLNLLLDHDKLNEALEILDTLHFADLADFLDNTSHKFYHDLLPALLSNFKPETLVYLNSATTPLIIDAIGVDKSAKLIDQLPIEDVIDIVSCLEEKLKSDILDKISIQKKQQVIEGFNYPENSVGRVIERNFLTINEKWIVTQVHDFLIQESSDLDFNALIVVNSKMKPVGTVLLSTILKSQKNLTIKNIMDTDLKMADAYSEISELIFLFKQYSLHVVPVINKNGKIIGIVSIQNMLYIIDEQTEKEMLSISGIHDQNNIDNTLSNAKYRFPWLFVNLITACATSLVINQFSATIAQLITVAVIMPIVASMSGNAGMQSMAVTIRALANKDIITRSNTLKVIFKEVLICSINGLLMAIIGALLIIMIISDQSLSIIFAIAVILNFIIAGFLGSAIPITLNNLNVDPSTASGVFLTALTDALAFFTFLSLVYLFLV